MVRRAIAASHLACSQAWAWPRLRPMRMLWTAAAPAMMCGTAALETDAVLY